MSGDLAPGDLVVCVDASVHGKTRHPGKGLLKVGAIYTVRGLTYSDRQKEQGVYLQEIHLPLYRDGSEYGFKLSRFRPVRKSSIQVFREMLVSPPKLRNHIVEDA
jgi:hypothetical protein